MSGSDDNSLESVLAFVVWLTAKTQQGRIFWQRQSETISATIRDLTLQFDVSNPRTAAESWHTFTVHTVGGEELFRLTSLSVATEKPPFVSPVETLFLMALGHTHIH